MHANYAYCLTLALEAHHRVPGARILDYGCGAGEVVQAGRAEGLDIFGVEVFYEGGSYREHARRAGLLGTAIREIVDGRIDFPDGTFDLVFSNQVFEHVEDLDAVLAEIDRVLNPGGVLVALFPSRDVIREGHCGIPMLHWFTKGSSWRYPYGLALRRLGLGYHKGTKTPSQWTRDFLDWLDRYTFYRSRREIVDTFERRFQIALIEDEYIRFRAARTRGFGWVGAALAVPPVRPLAREAFRKLGGLVIRARRR